MLLLDPTCVVVQEGAASTPSELVVPAVPGSLPEDSTIVFVLGEEGCGWGTHACGNLAPNVCSGCSMDKDLRRKGLTVCTSHHWRAQPLRYKHTTAAYTPAIFFHVLASLVHVHG
jgi:hypothetical protein